MVNFPKARSGLQICKETEVSLNPLQGTVELAEQVGYNLSSQPVGAKLELLIPRYLQTLCRGWSSEKQKLRIASAAL